MELQYFDEMHRKNIGGKGALYKILLVLACIVLAFIFLVVFSQIIFEIGFMLAAGTVYGTYILMRNMNQEFEYIFTDGEIDVDVIKGRSARKRMITIKPKDVEIVAKATGSLYESYKANGSITKKFDFSDGNPHNTYFFIVNGTAGKRLVLLSPSERLAEAVKFYVRDRMK